jgi:hypothetical protein
MASETEVDLLGRLAKTLKGEKATATFACGGELVSKLVESGQNVEPVEPSNPILFYEDKDGQSHKIVFPASNDELEHLVSGCEQATFGVGNEEKLDTKYRSAWKLDTTRFATSFHPFDSDIMEVVKHLLFSVNVGAFQPLIVAELYKLNVCPYSSSLTIDL